MHRVMPFHPHLVLSPPGTLLCILIGATFISTVAGSDSDSLCDSGPCAALQPSVGQGHLSQQVALLPAPQGEPRAVGLSFLVSLPHLCLPSHPHFLLSCGLSGFPPLALISCAFD